MNNRNSKEERGRKDVKYFIIVFGALIALLFVFTARADEIVMAEAPFNVGGNNDSFAAAVVNYISDSGNTESGKQSAPDILYAPGSSIGGTFIYVDVSDEPDNGNPSESNPAPSVINDVVRNGDKEVEQDPKPEDSVEIYVPDSDDDCPISDRVPLSPDVQQYIWTKCKKVTGDYKNYYAFILGTIQMESEFKRTAIHYNNNGTTDRGLMQINSCNISSCKRAGLITCTDDLWDIYKNIDCGFHEMNDYIKKFGVCEAAYFAYNTGRQNGGSNKASRAVMRNMSAWNTILFG